MYIESYGYLNLTNLGIYIKSHQDCDSVGNAIKCCYLSVDSFLKSLDRKVIMSDNLLNSVMKEFDIKSIVRARALCTQYINTGSVSNKNINVDLLKEVINKESQYTYVTSSGEELTPFQNKFVEYIDRKFNSVVQGNRRGIDVYLDTIDKAVTMSTHKPYLLGRLVQAIVNYKSMKSLVDNLDTSSKAGLSSIIIQINDFEKFYINSKDSADDTKMIINLVNSMPKIRHLIRRNTDPNVMVLAYMREYVKGINVGFINDNCGTNLSEIEIYKELLDLENKGLCGFSLPVDTLLDSLENNGVYFDRERVDTSSLADNDNIKFITGPLREMAIYEYELRSL